jgi:predicted amidohydrolase
MVCEWLRAFRETVRREHPTARISVPLADGSSASQPLAGFAYWEYSRDADEVVLRFDVARNPGSISQRARVANATAVGITGLPAVIEIVGESWEPSPPLPDPRVLSAGIALKSGAAGVQIVLEGDAELPVWASRVADLIATRKRSGTLPRGDPPRILYYVSKWQNYYASPAEESIHHRQFNLWEALTDAGISARIISDANLTREDLRAPVMLIPYAPVMDVPARERLRSLSWGIRIVAGERPGVFTPAAKTKGQFGAKIELVPRLLKDGFDTRELAQPKAGSQILRVAAAQFHTCFDTGKNASRIVELLRKAASDGVDVVAFSEMALTGYTKRAEFREDLDWGAVDSAIEEIRRNCDALNIGTVVGAPKRENDNVYIAAIAIDSAGTIVDAYEKVYLAGEKWATPGRFISTFPLYGTSCGTLICHDERYPHLVQLRALAGARLFFYISCESGVDEEHKIEPYRAQIQARAVENEVFIVHANAPARQDDGSAEGTSHGHSRIVAPDGSIIAEAGAFEETLVIADIDLRHASAGRSANLSAGPAAPWIADGIESLVNAARP